MPSDATKQALAELQYVPGRKKEIVELKKKWASNSLKESFIFNFKIFEYF